MIHLKDGVELTGIRPELLLAIFNVHSLFQEHGYKCVITSLVEGKHSATSLHYAGCAVDFRTRDIAPDVARLLAAQLKQALGTHFDVIIEDTHLHIEYQPRRAG